MAVARARADIAVRLRRGFAAPRQRVFSLTGTDREVRAPEKLVYTWRWEAEPELGETLVTVEFREADGGTEVILTHELFPSEQAGQDHRGDGAAASTASRTPT